MWVRSQDKCYLVDVNGCYIYGYLPIKGKRHMYEYRIVGLICEPTIEDNEWILGIYKTEEKAMSALDELQCRIARTESGVFQMPEDDDD